MGSSAMYVGGCGASKGFLPLFLDILKPRGRHRALPPASAPASSLERGLTGGDGNQALSIRCLRAFAASVAEQNRDLLPCQSKAEGS
jgi:hypothetical protein